MEGHGVGLFLPVCGIGAIAGAARCNDHPGMGRVAIAAGPAGKGIAVSGGSAQGDGVRLNGIGGAVHTAAACAVNGDGILDGSIEDGNGLGTGSVPCHVHRIGEIVTIFWGTHDGTGGTEGSCIFKRTQILTADGLVIHRVGIAVGRPGCGQHDVKRMRPGHQGQIPVGTDAVDHPAAEGIADLCGV